MKKSEILLNYTDYLILRNYSQQTIKTYLSAINCFLDYCIVSNNNCSDIQCYVKSFLTQSFKDGKSWSSVNIAYSSLKILLLHVLEESWNYDMLPRPKGRASIPTILSGREVMSMINVTSNFKHKLILILLYTAGLRISELINLDTCHILQDRLQLKVEKGKGGKGRIISLPKFTMKAIQLYLERYSPSTILIQGQSTDKLSLNRYSKSSIRKIVNKSAKAVGVKWKVSPHCLRHAYATHHIENGTDLVTLQLQLGHQKITTTIKYVKFCKSKIRHIHHPIEKLSIRL